MNFPKFGSIMCHYTAAATTQSVCYSGDHEPFLHGSSAAGWHCWMRSKQKAHQDIHSTGCLNFSKKLNQSYQTLKIRHISCEGTAVKIKLFHFFSILFFIMMWEYSCGKRFRIADDGVSTLQRSAVLQAGLKKKKRLMFLEAQRPNV